MSDSIQNYIAGGGVSGGIVAGLFIMYKCCYRKKLHSKCCGGELDLSSEPEQAVRVELQPSPSVAPVAAKSEPEPLTL